MVHVERYHHEEFAFTQNDGSAKLGDCRFLISQWRVLIFFP